MEFNNCTLINGDCLKEIPKLQDNSIDLCLTDPPYFLINKSGSGFMGKEWDSLNKDWFNSIVCKSKKTANVVENFFLLMKIDSNTIEENTVQKNANTNQCQKLKPKNLNAQCVEKNLKENKVKLKAKIASVQGIVLTKEEVLDMLNGLFPNHTTAIANQKESVKFVIPFSLIQKLFKNIVQENVLKFPTETLCKEKTILLTKMGEAKIQGRIEGLIGNGLEKKSIKEMVGNVKYVESIVERMKFSAIISNPINKQKIIRWITLLLFVGTATQELKGNLNPFLIEEFYYNWTSTLFPKLKPGAFLVFTMTPRQDLLWRCLAGIEKAGYELKTSGMYWLYHTGFPKALDVSKGIDKRRGKGEKEVIGLKKTLIELFNKCGKTRNKIDKECGFRASNYLTLPNKNKKFDRWVYLLPSEKKWKKISEVIGFGSELDNLFKDVKREIIGKSDTTIGIGGASPRMGGEHSITKPINETSKKWQGWKSFQLKPAVECIVVAQKPRTQKTITGQVLDNGCGAVNIAECRIPYANNNDKTRGGFGTEKIGFEDQSKNLKGVKWIEGNEQGRFPANLIVSGNPLQGELREVSGSAKLGKPHIGGHKAGFLEIPQTNNLSPNDSGTANRFYDIDRWAKKRNITLTQESALFDVPKPSKQEKNEGCEGLPLGEPPKTARSKPAKGRKNALGEQRQNSHPTCKPVTLFRYLATLFCQPNGTILDPFMGSGTTAIAALQENKKIIGIEQSQEYFRIAQARIKPYSHQTRLA